MEAKPKECRQSWEKQVSSENRRSIRQSQDSGGEAKEQERGIRIHRKKRTERILEPDKGQYIEIRKEIASFFPLPDTLAAIALGSGSE